MYPSLEEVRRIAASGDYRRVPVKRELLADDFTTIGVLRALRATSAHVFLLESAEPGQHAGRYSFLGFAPSMELSCLDGTLRVRRDVEFAGADPAIEVHQVDHPGDYLRWLIDENRTPRLEGFPTFTGGLVGYFSYDYLKYSEPMLRR